MSAQAARFHSAQAPYRQMGLLPFHSLDGQRFDMVDGHDGMLVTLEPTDYEQ